MLMQSWNETKKFSVEALSNNNSITTWNVQCTSEEGSVCVYQTDWKWNKTRRRKSENIESQIRFEKGKKKHIPCFCCLLEIRNANGPRFWPPDSATGDSIHNDLQTSKIEHAAKCDSMRFSVHVFVCCATVAVQLQRLLRVPTYIIFIFKQVEDLCFHSIHFRVWFEWNSTRIRIPLHRISRNCNLFEHIRQQ